MLRHWSFSGRQQIEIRMPRWVGETGSRWRPAMAPVSRDMTPPLEVPVKEQNISRCTIVKASTVEIDDASVS